MKVNISRIFETSKLLATTAGKELSELVQHVSDLSEQVLRALRNQLTFADNFDGIVSEVSVSDQIETTVYTNGRQPVGIMPLRVTSTSEGIDAFRWYVDDQGLTKIWVKFSPATTSLLTVRLVIFFS